MSDNQIAPQAGSTDMGIIAYICFAIGAFTGVGAIAGVIIAYMQREQDAGTWRESHDTWLTRTFWIATAGFVIAWVFNLTLIGIIIGFPLMGLVWIWYVIRLVKGWMAYDKKQPIAKPDDLLFG
ncbi:MAG: DUF4870 family protein [Sphingomonadales bacterium]